VSSSLQTHRQHRLQQPAQAFNQWLGLAWHAIGLRARVYVREVLWASQAKLSISESRLSQSSLISLLVAVRWQWSPRRGWRTGGSLASNSSQQMIRQAFSFQFRQVFQKTWPTPPTTASLRRLLLESPIASTDRLDRVRIPLEVRLDRVRVPLEVPSWSTRG
jgi:hypothetical protein